MSDSPSSRSFSTPVWVTLVVIVAIAAYMLGARASQTANGSLSAGNVVGSSGQVRGIGSRPPNSVAQDADFQEFWDLWSLLKTKFYMQPLDDQKLLYGAMSGLAAATGDPYTVFFEPTVASEFTKSLEGKFEGIGAEIGIKNEQLEIIAPLPGSPADKAGLRAGDYILAINATSTEGMSVERAVSMIRGDKGTTVVLTIGRIKIVTDAKGKNKQEPARFDVSIVRDTIVVKSVNFVMERDGIAKIEVNHFNSDTIDEFSKAIDQALAKDAKGIVLDLRSDPGGFLDRATAVAGAWVGDQVVVTERRQGKIVDEYHGTGEARLKGIPTVVLVNEGSASAAEIVAGALQDYGIAKLVGKKTFGKGSVQDFSELANGTAVKITVAEWLTPKGRFINQVGIEPDITVDRTEDDYHADRDPQLDKALELLTGTSSTSPALRAP